MSIEWSNPNRRSTIMRENTIHDPRSTISSVKAAQLLHKEPEFLK
jgi:hypothetical protein